ncbi:hypothetical protein HBA55_34795 [Pseudomaricurvus alkylphenolicus]|uniref:hypothetical protein n=1 Tax=Pseudomaricurvus alkylphenolicus TaxID=1306991 RepID=UPI00141F1E98|nr:hypothetical protein [Pseudomaricurvus alkylphenolicus]NIB44801.1 hypothetical protein [Pseudomaricurvus alkylphenolicus]
MSRVWREIADPKKHSDFMSTYNEGGIPVKKSRDNLIEKWVYLAEVCGFTFQFASIEQVKECKAYFEKKVHPSTRDIHPPHEHYWHPWYCKLPKGINGGTKRQKVLKTLDQILEKWGQ